MLISNSHKFIYIHLHKTAGTSIENALAGTLAWNDILLGSTNYGERLQEIYRVQFGLHKHSSAQDVLNVVGNKIWHEYFSFGTVRNPYSLVISQYAYSMRLLKETLKYEKSDMPNLESSPVGIWPWSYPGVKALIDGGGINANFSDFIRSPKLSWRGFISQKKQLCNDEGTLLLKMVVKAENLDSNWPEICKRLNINYIPLEHLNISTNVQNSYREFYRDKADIAFIQELFHDDFEFFNYPREIN